MNLSNLLIKNKAIKFDNYIEFSEIFSIINEENKLKWRKNSKILFGKNKPHIVAIDKNHDVYVIKFNCCNCKNFEDVVDYKNLKKRRLIDALYFLFDFAVNDDVENVDFYKQAEKYKDLLETFIKGQF